MTHNYLKHLFTALLLLCTTVVTAHEFEVGGIYYNILSKTDKTVEVTFKGTSTSEYSNEYTGNVVIPTSVTKSEIVTNILETFDDWRSSNKSNSTTSQTSYTLNVEAGNILKFDWLVSSERNYDWLIITLDGTEIVKTSGTFSGSYEKTFDVAGTHTLLVKYTKDSSSYGGNDEGEICNITLNSIVCVEELEYSVTSIGNYAFYGCTGLTSVVIPNSVTSIGDNAFAGCTGLTNVVIPNSVTSIGDNAFRACHGLTSVVIPNSVTSIGVSVFAYCKGLASISVENGNNIYDSRLNCNAIIETATNTLILSCKNTVIPSSVTSIGESAFSSCTGLTSITIPNSITSIGNDAFLSCDGLASIELGNNVESIGNSAFRGCHGLTSVVIPNSVTSIGDSAFEYCSKLTNVVIGNSVTSIGERVFYDCKCLTRVVIGNSVTGIGKSAFENCTGLTNLEVPYSITSIEERAFYYCTGLTSIVIPNSVASIGESAFSSCTGLTSITIPDSVTSIGEYAFSSCTGLTSIVVGNGVTSIGEGVFANCSGLTSVEIPNSVTSIENRAFEYCSKLTNVVIPNSVRSIGNRAFYYCTGLTSIVVGNGVTSIGDNAFSGCSRLTSIDIPNSVTSIGEYAFNSCTGLKKVCISDLTAWCNIHFVDSYANPLFYAKNLYLNGEKVTNLIIPSSVTSICIYAFENCTGLKSITIPNSVTSIGGGAFSGCTGLKSVVIPNNVTSIGDAAFNGCSGLTSVEIPNSVTSIGNSAFRYCTGLKSVVIPNCVTFIGESAFQNCSGLTSITSLIPADKLFVPGNFAFIIVDKTLCTLYVPYGAKETYASTSGWSEFANIVELEQPSIKVSINEYGCATYCSPYALDFSNVEGLKAYAATGYNKVTQVVTLTRLQTAEAGVGLFLKGEPGEYVVPVIEYSNDYSLNLLVGTLEQMVVNSTEGEMSNYKFTIADGDAAPMFYPFEDNTTFSAGKAYLQIPTAWLPSTAHKSLSIRFDDGETTDIDELKGENGKLKGESGKVKTIYDLSGRVVENPTSGIYIIDGKKVVVK